MQDYKGAKYHTAAFPREYDFRTKNVGVIGFGSTGIQLITTIAKEVGRLTCFQRRPQYSVPACERPVIKEDRTQINEDYEKTWDRSNPVSLVWDSMKARPRPSVSRM